jgi:hypothetical protein
MKGIELRRQCTHRAHSTSRATGVTNRVRATRLTPRTPARAAVFGWGILGAVRASVRATCRPSCLPFVLAGTLLEPVLRAVLHVVFQVGLGDPCQVINRHRVVSLAAVSPEVQSRV